MPRQSHNSFEFTGAEALEAEKAAEKRPAAHTRRRKRSIITLASNPSSASKFTKRRSSTNRLSVRVDAQSPVASTSRHKPSSSACRLTPQDLPASTNCTSHVCPSSENSPPPDASRSARLSSRVSSPATVAHPDNCAQGASTVPLNPRLLSGNLAVAVCKSSTHVDAKQTSAPADVNHPSIGAKLGPKTEPVSERPFQSTNRVVPPTSLNTRQSVQRAQRSSLEDARMPVAPGADIPRDSSHCLSSAGNHAVEKPSQPCASTKIPPQPSNLSASVECSNSVQDNCAADDLRHRPVSSEKSPPPAISTPRASAVPDTSGNVQQQRRLPRTVLEVLESSAHTLDDQPASKLPASNGQRSINHHAGASAAPLAADGTHAIRTRRNHDGPMKPTNVSVHQRPSDEQDCISSDSDASSQPPPPVTASNSTRLPNRNSSSSQHTRMPTQRRIDFDSPHDVDSPVDVVQPPLKKTKKCTPDVKYGQGLASDIPKSPVHSVKRPAIPAQPRNVKRVRFSEPGSLERSSSDKSGLINVMKLHRKRSVCGDVVENVDDVSVVSAEFDAPDEKTQQVLLDELQYAMDGILGANKKTKLSTSRPSNSLTVASLQGLISLLLRKPSRSMSKRPPKGFGNTLLLSILSRQPQLLSVIVKRLFALLGESKSVDVLLSVVFVIIFRSTAKQLLLGEEELDLLLNAFFRNSAVSLKEDKGRLNGAQQVEEQKPPQPFRRGRLARRFDAAKQPEDVLSKVNSSVQEGGIVEEEFKGFRNTADGAAYLIASALSIAMLRHEKLRGWMRKNRRLDKVVAVLYSGEKIMFSKLAASSKGKEDGEESEESGEQRREFCAAMIVTGAAIRILEVVTLDGVCQRRISRECRVIDVVLSVINSVTMEELGRPEFELLVSAGLKLCMNLTHECSDGSFRFSRAKGAQIVIDCLAKEGQNAQLLGQVENEAVESFDIRVLCLALLTSMADQENSIREEFCDIDATGLAPREGGAIAMVLELLKSAGQMSTEDNGTSTLQHVSDDHVGRGRRHVLGKRDEMESQEGLGSTVVMERKVTIGYLCLLIGALVRKSEKNRAIVRAALPDNSLGGVAGVLEEFLEFHREIGLTAGPIESLYKPIVRSLLDLAGGERIDAIDGKDSTS